MWPVPVNDRAIVERALLAVTETSHVLPPGMP